jgi:hypothetical protein
MAVKIFFSNLEITSVKNSNFSSLRFVINYMILFSGIFSVLFFNSKEQEKV